MQHGWGPSGLTFAVLQRCWQVTVQSTSAQPGLREQWQAPAERRVLIGDGPTAMLCVACCAPTRCTRASHGPLEKQVWGSILWSAVTSLKQIAEMGVTARLTT